MSKKIKINLDNPDIMGATEASHRWGYSETYVRQMFRRYPDKFPKGTIRKFSGAIIVTREGMEALTGHEEKSSPKA